MTRWRYRVFSEDIFQTDEIQAALDRAGEQGWELASVVKLHGHDGDTKVRAFLKKPLD